jgi:hypothetical protein
MGRYVAKDTDQWQALVNTVMDHESREFLD